jgi:hypothetical protein
LEVDKPYQKILEFNKILIEDFQYADNCISEEKENIFKNMIEKLKNKSQHETLIFEDNELELFFLHILLWPIDYLIPVLDLCRMFLLTKCIDKDFSNNFYKTKIYLRILECLEKGSLNHKIISLRILNNFFKGPRGIEFMETNGSIIIPNLIKFVNENHKGIRSAIAGICLK